LISTKIGSCSKERTQTVVDKEIIIRKTFVTTVELD